MRRSFKMAVYGVLSVFAFVTSPIWLMALHYWNQFQIPEYLVYPLVVFVLTALFLNAVYSMSWRGPRERS